MTRLTRTPCWCGECEARHRKKCPLACPFCGRALIGGACHWAEDHPEPRPYYSYPSRKRDPATQCQGKLKWPTKKQAKLHLRRARNMRDRDNVQPYLCPHCRYWHTGHKRGTKEAGVAAPSETRYTEPNAATTGGGEGENSP